MTEKLIWEGEASSFYIHSGEDDGHVSRHAGRETIDNKNGTYTSNELFEEFLPKFQGDIILFSADDFYIGEIESTCEYYDYVAHFQEVIKVEQRTSGDVILTLKYHSYHSSARGTIKQ